ncbi:hypothetical protein MHYP_G00145170 [Metynnis hypsauchen]
MDPADLNPIKSALQNQGAVIGRHEQLLHDMMQQLTLLVRTHTEGAQPASASTGVGAGAGASTGTPVLASPFSPTNPNPIHSDALVANPERYAGDPETCRGFLLQCSLVFEQQPSRFPTERSKVAYMISLLTGRALAWATSLWELDSPDTASGESFKRAMRTTFHNPRGGREVAPRLLALSQGTHSVADYAIKFRTLAAESGWNEEALMAVFQQGLNGRLKDELATRELPSTLEGLYDSNGQTERVNQDLARTLRCLTSTNPSSWAEHLPWAEYAHNTLRHSSLGMSPFECQFGFPPPMFPEEEREVGVPAAEQFVQRCRRAWQKARASLLTTAEARKQVADRRRRPAPTFRPGQRVWLSAKDLPLHVESKKLAPRYVGPFKIDRRVNPVSYRLCLPPSMRVHPTFHVSRLRPFLCGTRPPAPRLVAGSPAYTVRRLLDSRCVRGGVQYLVDWEGYGPEERSWVPASHILDPGLIKEFRRARAGGLGTSGAVPRRGGPVRVQPAPSAASRGRRQQGAQPAPPAARRGRQRQGLI